jgi:hypothetical protein
MLVLFVEDLEELHCEATAEALETVDAVDLFLSNLLPHSQISIVKSLFVLVMRQCFAARGSKFKGAVHARCRAEIQLA